MAPTGTRCEDEESEEDQGTQHPGTQAPNPRIAQGPLSLWGPTGRADSKPRTAGPWVISPVPTMAGPFCLSPHLYLSRSTSVSLCLLWVSLLGSQGGPDSQLRFCGRLSHSLVLSPVWLAFPHISPCLPLLDPPPVPASPAILPAPPSPGVYVLCPHWRTQDTLTQWLVPTPQLACSVGALSLPLWHPKPSKEGSGLGRSLLTWVCPQPLPFTPVPDVKPQNNSAPQPGGHEAPPGWTWVKSAPSESTAWGPSPAQDPPKLARDS